MIELPPQRLVAKACTSCSSAIHRALALLHTTAISNRCHLPSPTTPRCLAQLCLADPALSHLSDLLARCLAPPWTTWPGSPPPWSPPPTSCWRAPPGGRRTPGCRQGMTPTRPPQELVLGGNMEMVACLRSSPTASSPSPYYGTTCFITRSDLNIFNCVFVYLCICVFMNL